MRGQVPLNGIALLTDSGNPRRRHRDCCDGEAFIIPCRTVFFREGGIAVGYFRTL